jgi:hypothetical protein
MSLWLISVVRVKRIESPWTTFFSIVRLTGPYGMFSSVDSDCLTLCLNE